MSEGEYEEPEIDDEYDDDWCDEEKETPTPLEHRE